MIQQPVPSLASLWLCFKCPVDTLELLFVKTTQHVQYRSSLYRIDVHAYGQAVKKRPSVNIALAYPGLLQATRTWVNIS